MESAEALRSQQHFAFEDKPFSVRLCSPKGIGALKSSVREGSDLAQVIAANYFMPRTRSASTIRVDERKSDELLEGFFNTLLDERQLSRD